jgi:diaminopropionate ammonia-lyase
MTRRESEALESPRIVYNPSAARFVAPAASPDALAFHRKLPGYTRAPLVAAPGVAAKLGVRQVWVKDESSRLGLPAYKILGASWATYRALDERFGPFAPWETLPELAARLHSHGPLTLVAATDGNHGRAVARMARWLDIGADIFVPRDMAPARREAISSEGAQVTVVDGSYDQAVEASARLADDKRLVISDTAWEGYERIPAWVIEGYATIFHEIDAQLSERGAGQPDLVAAQMGVGALAAAVVRHYRRPDWTMRVVGVEPTRAACVLNSAEAGRLVETPGPHDSIMSGLNCGRPSPVAWPFVSGGVSMFIAVPDTRAEEAMRLLADDGIVSGESGAAGLAGCLEALGGEDAPRTRSLLGVDETSALLLISTEGATDPEAYAQIVGHRN